MDWIWEGKVQVWKKFRGQVDQMKYDGTATEEEYERELMQDIEIINWALDRKY